MNLSNGRRKRATAAPILSEKDGPAKSSRARGQERVGRNFERLHLVVQLARVTLDAARFL